MWALQDARLPTGAIADVVIDGDRIARLGPGAADGLKDRLDCLGKLVLPGFVDGHVHLDKVLIRDELREHVRLCFELATRFNRDLDMHVDETDDGGVRTLEMVADEALARGFVGRVCAGHVCSLAAVDDDYADRVIEKCRRAGISIAANPVTNLVLQGRGDRGLIRRGTTRIGELRAAGVNGLVGQDCVKDGFYPFGRGSMLEVALISAHAAHLTNESDLDFALRAVTEAPAQAMRLLDYGLRPGARADLQLLPVPSWAEAMRLQPPPEKVWFSGRLVAENTIRSELYRATTPPVARQVPG